MLEYTWVMKMNEYPAISLFSGAQGLDVGLGLSGIDVRVGQDVEKTCVETMKLNNHVGILGDIRTLSPEDILATAGMKRGEPFLVCGGPPCQPFSTAGKRLGIRDPRGSLFMDFVRMLDSMMPRFFVMENVKGLLSMDGVVDIILNEFDKLGYHMAHGLLDAVDYGVPQFRERLVFIGSRDGEDVFLPVPTHFRRHQDESCRWATLHGAIGDLEDYPGECAQFSKERLKYLKIVPEGGNWRSLPDDVQAVAMGGAYASGGGKVGFYRRLSYGQPAPTLVTSPVQKATMMGHPTKDRPLSVREYMRVQQFPDDWKLAGTITDKYRQVGNAVPVGLAKAIGDMLVSVAEGCSEVKIKRPVKPDFYGLVRDAMEM